MDGAKIHEVTPDDTKSKSLQCLEERAKDVSRQKRNHRVVRNRISQKMPNFIIFGPGHMFNMEDVELAGDNNMACALARVLYGCLLLFLSPKREK